MELVYLWVEKYKNIDKQGFNFSPRFSCRYDEIKKELEIIDKEETGEFYPKDFFGENINVTAIVGENGSGKSSIQKLIFMLIFLNKYKDLKANNSDDEQKVEAIKRLKESKKLKNKNIFLVLKVGDKFKKISYPFTSKNMLKKIIYFSISQKYCKNISELTKEELDFFSIYFNYMIDTWYDDKKDYWVNSIYHRVDGYETPILLEPYKGHKEFENYIDISNMEYLNNSKMFNRNKEIKNDFFNPTEIWMMIDEDKLIIKFKEIFNSSKNKILYSSVKYLKKIIKNKDLLTINKLYIISKILNSKDELFKNKNLKEEIKNKILEQSIEEWEKYLDEFSLDDLLKEKKLIETKKLEICIKFDKNFKNESDKLDKFKNIINTKSKQDDKTYEIDTVKKHFEKLLPWLFVEFFDEDKSYSSLSGGEKSFLGLFINLEYQINNILKLQDKYKTINLFLDEVELGLHPQWQKKFINELLIVLRNFQTKFNLIIASHSPFILSDIPKENIIFLKNGEQVKAMEKKQTFGANIHTLLANGFFMDGGLMGEFAKSKINDVYEYLADKNSTKEYTQEEAQNIIYLIGEPVLQKELQFLYDEKFEVDEIDKQIREHEEALKNLKLKKKQND